jgi:hypothetical protein
MTDDHEFKWDKTFGAKRKLESKGKLQAEDKYHGKPLITRDSKVIDGVYVSASKGGAPAIVVQRTPELEKLYQKALSKATVGGRIDKTKVLRAVYDTVRETIKYDEGADERLVQQYGLKPDDEISLDAYIKEHAGVCKHAALLCTAILERFKENGHIRGTPRVNRNSRYNPREGRGAGGHAWCRYKNSRGDVFILDTVQGFIGSLKDAKGKARWAYERPDD